jgi:hypothetical protein
MSRIAESAFGDRPYPGSPGFKEGTTSRDAAAAVTGGAAELREAAFSVIALAGERGATADEVAKVLRRDWRAIRPRISELAHAKPKPRIVARGDRRPNDTGLSAKVWRIAADG